ncbi:unnamed protein product, partial [Tuber aestivum]
MKDSRWNTVAFLLLRISQLVLGVIVLGIAAYFVSIYDEWFIPFTIVVSAFTLAWVGVGLSLFFTNNLFPLVVIMVDVVLAVSYIVSIAALAGEYSSAIGSPCIVYDPYKSSPDEFVSRHCTTLNGGFGILILEMLTFLGAIIWDGIVLYQNRNGKREGFPVPARGAVNEDDAIGEQIGEIRGAHGMWEPMADPPAGAGGAGGNHGEQPVLSYYQPTGPQIYPAQTAPPTAPYNPSTSHPLAPRVLQQDAMMYHQPHDQRQQQQIDQVHQIQGQQDQYQRQSQHQQYPQNRGPLPHELGGTY